MFPNSAAHDSSCCCGGAVTAELSYHSCPAQPASGGGIDSSAAWRIVHACRQLHHAVARLHTINDDESSTKSLDRTIIWQSFCKPDLETIQLLSDTLQWSSACMWDGHS